MKLPIATPASLVLYWLHTAPGTKVGEISHSEGEKSMGTVLVSGVLLAVVAAAVAALRRDRKRGKNSCGVGCCSGGCAGCSGCGQRGGLH